MFRDIIDYQESVRDRTRWIEVGPGPYHLRVPPPWDPAYDPLDEISLIAYAMLPFCAFRPDSLPAIPPQAQYLANILDRDGFTEPGEEFLGREHIHRSRAFTRAITCCGGLMIPHTYKVTSDAGGGVREMGVYTDTTGAEWRSQPQGRIAYFAAMWPPAVPPSDEYEATPGNLVNRYEWRLGAGRDVHDDPTYPPFGTYLGSPSGDGEYVYGAFTEGHSKTTISRGTAGYYQPDPPHPAAELHACTHNQYPDISWIPGDRPDEGIHDLSGPDDTPFCFPNPTGDTETGTWNMAFYDLDALAGLLLPFPPTYYMGEPFEEFIRDPDYDMISYPGWDVWRARVAEWCFGTSDWVKWMLPWYRRRRPRLSAAGTPSEHWQRMPLYLPWMGLLEYRIWQWNIYLRGTLYNPFYWFDSERLAPMPPGVEAVSEYGRTLAHGRTLPYSPVGRPFGIGFQTPGTLQIDRSDMLPGSPGHDTPEHLCLDNVSFPVHQNPPYVP